MLINGVGVAPCGSCGETGVDVAQELPNAIRKAAWCPACGVQGPWRETWEEAACAWNALHARNPAGQATRKVVEWTKSVVRELSDDEFLFLSDDLQYIEESISVADLRLFWAEQE